MRARIFFRSVAVVLVSVVSSSASAQFTIDGDFSETAYQLLATKQNANSGFGTDKDITNIYYGLDGNNLYLAIECKIQNTPNLYNPLPDGLGVFLNFTSEAGLAAGNPLGFDIFTDYHFLNGNHCENVTGSVDYRIDFKLDFELDYMFAFYSNGTSDLIKCDAATHIAGKRYSVQNIGKTDQGGTPVSGPYVDGVFSSRSITFAFQSSTEKGSRKGVELKIPFTEFNGTYSDRFQIFTSIVSSTGYFSDITIPGNASPEYLPRHLGYDPDFNSNKTGTIYSCQVLKKAEAIGTGPYHTDLISLESPKK